jgi:hypothetical protein
LRVLFLLITFFVASAQIDFRYHPELKWQRFETEHFAIVFHEGTKQSAIRVANIAEEIYTPITTLFAYEPDDKITFIMKDIDDYSNGGAYFLDDKIEIWTEHLDFDLRGTHEWLKDVVTHEFIHMIHIQKSLSSSKSLPFAILQWIGYEDERRKDVVRGFPNRLASLPLFFFNVPPWLAEGVAQHQLDGHRSDYRDAQREMILRDRFANNNVLSLAQMDIFGKSTVGNESVYNQGFSLVQFIVNRFGEDVLGKIAQNNSSFEALVDHDAAVFEKATGFSLDSIYTLWHAEKKAQYTEALRGIMAKKREGELLEAVGEANFYPTYSSDGTYLAYLSNGENRGFSQNELIIYNRKTGKKEAHTARISSQLTWLTNKHQLLYSKQIVDNQWGSSYNDLYLYDIKTKKETRLTNGLRARNAVITAAGRVSFISGHDGSSNVLSFELGEQKTHASLNWKNFTVEQTGDGWYLGTKLRFVTQKNDFTQYFHPVVADENHVVLDRSAGYKRSIIKLNLNTGEERVLRGGEADYRNPFLQGDTLYYASNKTGVFNIYRQVNSDEQALTNVVGAAFMPTVFEGELSYSLYKNAGFKIAQVTISDSLTSEDLLYSIEKSPFPLEDLNIKNTVTAETIKPKRQPYKFNSFYIVPRVLMDDKRPKFGFAFLANELLDKSSLYFTAIYNTIGERDIYAGIEVRNFSVFGRDPIFFFDLFNQSVKIDDRLRFKFDDSGQYVNANREVQFTLWQYELGWKLKLWSWLDWKSTIMWSKYDANLGASLSNEIYDNGRKTQLYFPFLRYTYHKGVAVEQKFLVQEKDVSDIGDIVPQSAYRSMLTITKNQNEFLDDFAFNTTGIEELYTTYNYYSVQLSASASLPNFWRHSGWTVELKAAKNLDKVDEFYDHYAGGWVGLKGYPYFAMHGQQSVVSSVYFNQLLMKDAMIDLGIFQMKHLAVSAFGQWGDAWNGSNFSWKSNAGVQLKAESYGPLKLFLEAVKPMNQVISEEKDSQGKLIPVVYPRDWRYYFGLMYDFELRDFL